jgi:hypothetical protein
MTHATNTVRGGRVGMFKVQVRGVEERVTPRESRATAMVDNRVCTAPRLDFVPIGTRVEIRNLHLDTWSGGFQVAAIINEKYLIRRVSDGRVLRCFGPDDIRPADIATRPTTRTA